MKRIFLHKWLFPKIVKQGDKLPMGYGCSRWIPFHRGESIDGKRVYRWEQVAYPIPINLLVSLFYRALHFAIVGFEVTPMYTFGQMFEVIEQCPHCKKNLNDPPFKKSIVYKSQ